MTRIQRILSHPDFLAALSDIEEAEKNRIFCCHGLSHLLDTARIAYLQALEQQIPLEKDLIYAAALLHDLGRAEQYRLGTPHHEAGPRVAAPILTDAGFTQEESRQILAAIQGHRCQDRSSQLGELLYRADKASRCCFACAAQAECNWSNEKKNFKLYW